MGFDELAIQYGTDKSSLNGHNYSPYYEKHLPKKINKLLEIGAGQGKGIKTFKAFYNDEGEFYSLDRFLEGHGLISMSELEGEGIFTLQGDHDDSRFLNTIKQKFDVISEDASHHWDSQISVFIKMFINNLEPKGVYVIEDIFDDIYWGRNLIKNKDQNIKGILTRFKAGEALRSDFISDNESNVLSSMIDEVFIYDRIIFIIKK